MSLSFLNPLIWFAALAIAAPIWLHLRRRRERNLVRFTAVRFLEDQPKARRSPMALRHLALLVCRALTVLLVVAAFAWPWWYKPNLLVPQKSVVYILDNTMSRQVKDGFVKDRERVLEDLAHAGPTVQIAVVELTSTPRVVADFKDDRDLARSKLAQLQPSFQRGSYLSAFRQANALLTRTAARKKQIILLSDSQANQWDENVGAPPFLRDVQIALPKPGVDRLPNLWLSDPHAERLILGEGSRMNFTLRLSHSGPAKSARVLLRVNGSPVLDQEVDLEHQPESVLLQAQCEADPASWLRAEASVDGEPDLLAADNHLYFAVPPIQEGSLALLCQSSFLRVALSPEVMRGHWNTRLLDPAHLEQEKASGQPADVLCLESAFLQDSGARELVKDYLAKGSGVFLLVNRTSPLIDSFLRELGLEPERQPWLQEAKPEHFQFVSFDHAIFHPFRSAAFGNLMEVTVSHYAHLRSAESRPLVFSEKGDGLFFESAKGPGKLLVSAFGMDREQTSWPIHPTFIPFLDLALQAARPRDPVAGAFESGDSTIWPLPAGVSAQAVVLRDEGREVRRASVEQNRVHLRLPDKPGIYAITLDDRVDVQGLVSVNAPAKESELVFAASSKPLNEWKLTGPQTRESAPQLEREAGFSGILQQRLWWWMVLGTLLALAIETTFACVKEGKI